MAYVSSFCGNITLGAELGDQGAEEAEAFTGA